MRLSSSLRRARWLVFGAWLLTLIPAVWLALTQSGHLTGGGFEVAGSQSLNVQYQLEDHFPGEGASPLALVAAPRPDATYADMNSAVDLLRQVVVFNGNVSISQGTMVIRADRVELREAPGLKKRPSTSELLDWIKLLMADNIPAEALRSKDLKTVLPPLHGALFKNEHDVHLLERLAFLSRREGR